MNEYQLSKMGIESPDELVGKTIKIATYETGSSGSFAIGKKVISVE
ncbi:MAG: hypothetical protein GF411_09535 [Candidatus Lokiarchaeota archaeon]|nr:hypothetical protein [Candidatus Lokiarchaeota archaeon]